MATRSLWAESDIDRLVAVNLESLCLAADTGILLIGLEHGAGLIVVKDEGPKIFGGNVGRQVQFVGFASVEGVTFGIHERGGILRAETDHFLGHGWGDPCGVKEEERVSVEQACTVNLELVTATNEGCDPGAIGVEITFFYPTPVGKGAGGGIAHCRRFFENRLHALVRRERFAFLDADGGEESQGERVYRVAWFMLYDLINRIPEGVIRRADGVKSLAGYVDEIHLRRMSGFCQRIDPHELLYTLNPRFRIAVLEKGTKEKDVSVGARMGDKVAWGNLTGVAVRQQEILPALALVRPRDAKVGDPAEPIIIKRTEDGYLAPNTGEIK